MIGEFIFRLFTEVIFYFTGAGLVDLFTFRKLKPGGWAQDNAARAESAEDNVALIYTFRGERYLRANVVAAIGFVFWAAVGITIWSVV